MSSPFEPGVGTTFTNSAKGDCVSTDLTDKSDEFRRGYLSCVDDMRAWFLSEQSKQDNERAKLVEARRQAALREKNAREKLVKRFGYRAGATDVLRLTLKQIAELKRELKLNGEFTPSMNKVLRAVRETR